MAPLISVVIPSYNSRDVLGPCLAALRRQTLAPGEIIVVDDGSADGTSEMVSSEFPEVSLLTLPQNQGFAAACNAGFEASAGEWIALLNADTEPDREWIARAMAKADRPDVGSVASLVLLPGEPQTIDSAGLRLDRAGFAYLRFHGEALAGVALRDGCEVFGPAGSAAFYRRRALGGALFAPDFGIYYEDVDIACRLRHGGWKCLLAADARVLHHHSYTMGAMKGEKRYRLQRNRLRCMARNWPGRELLKNAPLAAAYDCASIVVAAREGNLSAALRARADLIKYFRADLAARAHNAALAGGLGGLSEWIGHD